MSLLNIKPANL